jgi:K+/H+ antiporter YhaU regulatory subunit KhtT
VEAGPEVRMRAQKVRRRRLPHVGELYELDTGAGPTVSVVAHRSGRRDITVRSSDAEEPSRTLSLSRREALAVASLLSGSHVELVVTPEL